MGYGRGLFGYEVHSLIVSCREHGRRRVTGGGSRSVSPKGLGIDGIGWVCASRGYSRGIRYRSPWSLLQHPSLHPGWSPNLSGLL